MSKTLYIEQIRSGIGREKSQKRTLEALGIRRLHHVVEHEDSPQIRGMIRKVSHLVSVQESTPKRKGKGKK